MILKWYIIPRNPKFETPTSMIVRVVSKYMSKDPHFTLEYIDDNRNLDIGYNIANSPKSCRGISYAAGGPVYLCSHTAFRSVSGLSCIQSPRNPILGIGGMFPAHGLQINSVFAHLIGISNFFTLEFLERTRASPPQ